MGESSEMYLETILVLQRKSEEGVHAVDVSRAMGFSKPSVSVALKQLKKQGYIDIDGFDHIILLPKGREVAEEIYERHEILTDFFVKLGVPYEIAVKDACRIEHVVSKETFAALKSRGGLMKKKGKRSSKAKKN